MRPHRAIRPAGRSPRLERAIDPVAEGTRICVETIQHIRAIDGVAGVHLMAPKREHLIGPIVEASGVLAGRPAPVKPRGGASCPLLA